MMEKNYWLILVLKKRCTLLGTDVPLFKLSPDSGGPSMKIALANG